MNEEITEYELLLSALFEDSAIFYDNLIVLALDFRLVVAQFFVSFRVVGDYEVSANVKSQNFIGFDSQKKTLLVLGHCDFL